ncbi:hypothetical protein LSM04_008575 [Trypanosoma melophagium]|uniref:uncharacterized protein n=1 Tax=Trypanosoma melophagium TaxID=715481 RepID=UPI00351AA434|nr:hypothetical protein LSM04_008575 [Trypanosoma melophagium]
MSVVRQFLVSAATQSSSSLLFLQHFLHSRWYHHTLSVHSEVKKKETFVDDELTKLVLQCDENSKRPFGGSIFGGILTLMGFGLCGLTFLYNVGKPVLGAYHETLKGKEEE